MFDKASQSWVERGRGLLRLNDMASTEEGSLQSRLGTVINHELIISHESNHINNLVNLKISIHFTVMPHCPGLYRMILWSCFCTSVKMQLPFEGITLVILCIVSDLSLYYFLCCSDEDPGQFASDPQHQAVAPNADGQSQREERPHHSHGH